MGDVVYLDVNGDGGLFPEPNRQPGGDTSRGRGFGVEVKRRLKDRQAAAIARGQHPLSVALRGPLPLLAVEDEAERPTCGSCRYRRPYNPGHARAHPKCLAHPRPRHTPTPDGGEYTWTEFPRVTNGEGTDCRAGWPACIDYLPKPDPEPKETTR